LAKSNQTTLCYIERDGQYLMMHRVKKEHDINKDKWVGIGGHFEQDESPEECLLRETREETGLTLTDYRLRGVITFISDKWQTEYMFLYTATGYEGKIGDCNEGTLEWIDRTDVYDLPIWAGDRIFFRLLEWRQDFFSLKLRYVGEQLTEVMLDGQALSPEAALNDAHI
jgi:8-oxo-dGTP diphosphatase